MAGQVDPLKRAIRDTYQALPKNEYFDHIHSRQSVGEAVAWFAKHAMTYTSLQNEMLLEALHNDNRFCALLSYTVPAAAFVGDTFSIPTSGTQRTDLYTSFLPKPTPDALKQKTSGKGGAASTTRLEHTYEFSEYVPGDPKTVQLPLQQMSNLLHLFCMLPFLANQYHEAISAGDQLVDRTIEKYNVMCAEIKKCTGVGNDRWTTILDKYKGPDGTPPWCPFIVEEIREDCNSVTAALKTFSATPRVIAYRFCVFMNRHLERNGDDLQKIIDKYFKELRNRLAYHSECVFMIRDLLSKKQAIVVLNNGNRQQQQQGANAQIAQANAGPPPNASPHLEKMYQLIDNHKHDKNKAAETLATTQIRSWEGPKLNATNDPHKRFLNPSTILAMHAKAVYRIGDNIYVPPISKRYNDADANSGLQGASRRPQQQTPTRSAQAGHHHTPMFHIPDTHRQGNIYTRFSRHVSASRHQKGPNRGGTNQAQSTNVAVGIASNGTKFEDITEELDKIEKLADEKIHLISQPKVFSNCFYLPNSDLRVYEFQDNKNPTAVNDPRRIENIFHPLIGFSHFADTAADQRQLNPFVYFDFGDNALEEGAAIKAEEFPPYVIPAIDETCVHSKWQSLREEVPAITYGGLINQIHDKAGLQFHTLYNRFKGFPDFAIEQKCITLILPTLQPWEFGMLPLPNVVRSIPMFSLVASTIKNMVLSSDVTSTQFLGEVRNAGSLSLASLYLTCLISTETINVDIEKYKISKLTQVTLRSDVATDTRSQDLAADRISIPASISDIDSAFNNILKMMEIRSKSARMNIGFRDCLPMRIAYDTNQPCVRQPHEPDTGHSTAASNDPDYVTMGMDIFFFGGEVGTLRNNLVNEMCGYHYDTSGTNSTELPSRLSPTGDDQGDFAIEKQKRPMRLRAFLVLTKGLEEIGHRLLLYCLNVPKSDSYQERDNKLFKRLGDDTQMPVPWLPLPSPLSSMYEEFNKRNSSEKWANFNVSAYNNTSPLEELFSYQAQTAVTRYKVFAGVDTFLLLIQAVRSSLMYSRSLNAIRLHILMAGDTATSKSYQIRIITKLLTEGMVSGANMTSKKEDTAYINNNCHVDAREEAPWYITEDPDKKGSNNSDDLAKWKVLADAARLIYYYLHANDPSLAASDTRMLYRKKGMSLGLLSNIFLWALNNNIKNMQPAALHRFLVIHPPLLTDNAKSLPGSGLNDYALRRIDAFGHILTGPFRVKHYYAGVLRMFCYLNPRYQVDLDDALNLIGEVLRTAKQHLPKDVYETRRSGRIGQLLETICFENATHMALRDLMDDLGKYAPCAASSEYLTLRHIPTNVFLARAVKYLYATIGQALLTLTLLKDVLESPIRTSLMELLAKQAYPSGSTENTAFKVVVETQGEQIFRYTDFNVVVIKTQFTQLRDLYKDLGKQVSESIAYSPEQIETTLTRMKEEMVDMEACEDNNLGKAPHPVESHLTERRRRKANKNKKPPPAKKSGVASTTTASATEPPVPKAVSLAEAMRNNPEAANFIRAGAPGATSDLMDVDNDNNTATATTNNNLNEDPAQDDDAMLSDEALFNAVNTTANERAAHQDTSRVKFRQSNFSIKLISIEKNEKGFYCIHICHETLRKFYQENGDNDDPTTTATRRQQQKTNVVDPWEKSHIWKAFVQVIQKKSFNRYPEFVNRLVEDNATEKFCERAKKVFREGPYTYLTARVDGINKAVAPYLKDAKKTVSETYKLRKKKPPPVPSALPTRWLINSPPITRPENGPFMTLARIMDDTDLDKNYVFGESVVTAERSTATTSFKVRYEYDLDYTALSRRCVRLGYDIRQEAKYLPLLCRLKKYTDKEEDMVCYPETSIMKHTQKILDSLLADEETDYGDLLNVDAPLDRDVPNDGEQPERQQSSHQGRANATQQQQQKKKVTSAKSTAAKKGNPQVAPTTTTTTTTSTMSDLVGAQQAPGNSFNLENPITRPRIRLEFDDEYDEAFQLQKPTAAAAAAAGVNKANKGLKPKKKKTKISD